MDGMTTRGGMGVGGEQDGGKNEWKEKNTESGRMKAEIRPKNEGRR